MQPGGGVGGVGGGAVGGGWGGPLAASSDVRVKVPSRLFLKRMGGGGGGGVGGGGGGGADCRVLASRENLRGAKPLTTGGGGGKKKKYQPGRRGRLIVESDAAEPVG